MNSVELAVSKIEKPYFNPKYVISKFGDILTNDSSLFLGNNMSKFDFDLKIRNLIRRDNDSLDGYLNNYTLNHYYKYDIERNIYTSSLISIYECLLKHVNYKFPKFLNSLNNEFEFNSVMNNMIEKHTKESMKIHKRLRKENPGYTFHSLSVEEMEKIVGEAYKMCMIVKNFLNNLSEEEKNYINIVENEYMNAINELEKKGKNFVSIIIYKNSNEYYVNKYNIEPPKINFDSLYQ